MKLKKIISEWFDNQFGYEPEEDDDVRGLRKWQCLIYPNKRGKDYRQKIPFLPTQEPLNIWNKK